MISRYRIKGHSMEPNFYEGERLLVSSLFFKLKKGDVVVFSRNGKDYLKRIAAVDMSETLKRKPFASAGGKLPAFLSMLKNTPWALARGVLDKNKFAVAGDNKNHSSSYNITRKKIKGKLLMKY